MFALFDHQSRDKPDTSIWNREQQQLLTIASEIIYNNHEQARPDNVKSVFRMYSHYSGLCTASTVATD